MSGVETAVRAYLDNLLPDRVVVFCTQTTVHQRVEDEVMENHGERILKRDALDDVVQQLLPF